MKRETENEKLVTEFFHRYVTGGNFLELVAEDIVLDYRGAKEVPLTGIYKGHEGLMKLASIIGAKVKEFKEYKVEHVLTNADKASAFGYARIVTPNNQEKKINWALLMTIEDGKIKHWIEVADLYTVMQVLQDEK